MSLFKKIMIANRGEIAVRIIRTCREMGIATLALYEASDRGSLHVRLADECVALPDHTSFMDREMLLAIAKERGADAIHPGYGYLAEDFDFIQACHEAGIVFIGPPAEVVKKLRNKIGTLSAAEAAGLKTAPHSAVSFAPDASEALYDAAEALGYPLVIKSCSGGRGRGERLVMSPDHLAEAVRRAQVETQSAYGDSRLYLERAILPAHQVGVQILGDGQGNVIHLGDREGSLIFSNQKIVEESPALCLTPEKRNALLQAAVDLARAHNYRNAGTVEFLVDGAGEFYFTEFKSRIQVEHTLTEMITRIDLIREQIRIAAGEQLELRQEDVRLEGWAMMCRIRAEDPFHRFMPSPGRLRRVRVPGGPEVRADTYVYGTCDIPAVYDPLIAKLTVWAPDRAQCVQRMRRALEDFALIGPPTNLPLLQRVMRASDFIEGRYATDFLSHPFAEETLPMADTVRRDLAIAAAVVYALRRESFEPQTPELWNTGWHRSSRRLPE